MVARWGSPVDVDPEMRLRKAFGDAAFVLLLAVVLVGPAARLWRPVRGLLSARRALGIWFALAASCTRC
jgi:methionine sulfoxide reductase heme-binding subunit